MYGLEFPMEKFDSRGADFAAPWSYKQLNQAPIWMRRGIAFACFGIVTVSTPFFPLALTFSPSTVSGNTKRR